MQSRQHAIPFIAATLWKMRDQPRPTPTPSKKKPGRPRKQVRMSEAASEGEDADEGEDVEMEVDLIMQRSRARRHSLAAALNDQAKEPERVCILLILLLRRKDPVFYVND